MKLIHEFWVSGSYHFDGAEKVFESGADDIPKVGLLDVAPLVNDAGIVFNPDESEIIYATGQTTYHGPFSMLSAATRDENGLLQFDWGVSGTVSRIVGYVIRGRGVNVSLQDISRPSLSGVSEGIEGKVEMDTAHLTRFGDASTAFIGDAFAAVKEGAARILRLEELVRAKMSAYSEVQMDKYVTEMAPKA